jgi:hypothetical protein
VSEREREKNDEKKAIIKEAEVNTREIIIMKNVN